MWDLSSSACCSRVFVCADDFPGSASVWSPAAGALWRSGGESGNTPAKKWSTEFKNHHSWDWDLIGPGTCYCLYFTPWKYYYTYIFCRIYIASSKRLAVQPLCYIGGQSSRFNDGVMCGALHIMYTNKSTQNPVLFYIMGRVLGQKPDYIIMYSLSCD